MSQLERDIKLTRSRAHAVDRPRLKGATAASGRTNALTRYRRMARRMAVTDALAIALACLGARAVWISSGLGTPPSVSGAAVYPLLQVLLFTCFRLYAPHRLAAAEEYRRVVIAVAVGQAVLVMLSPWPIAPLSRGLVALTWFGVVTLVSGTRAIWRRRAERGRIEGDLALRTIVVGTNAEGRRIAAMMASQPEAGFRPVAFVATTPADDLVDGKPVVARLTDPPDWIRGVDADCVFIAASALDTADVASLTRSLRLEDVEVRLSTNLPELLMSRLTIHPIGDLPSLSLRPARLSGGQALVKRAMDVTLSAIALAILGPLMVAIAVAIEATSTGPVLFRQSASAAAAGRSRSASSARWSRTPSRARPT